MSLTIIFFIFLNLSQKHLIVNTSTQILTAQIQKFNTVKVIKKIYLIIKGIDEIVYTRFKVFPKKRTFGPSRRTSLIKDQDLII